MKSFELFIKTDCKFCKKAVDLLSLKGSPFIVTVCDKNPDYLETVKKLYGWETVPLILSSENDGSPLKLVGGCNELEEMLLNANTEN